MISWNHVLLYYFIISFVVEYTTDKKLKPYNIFGEENRDTIIFVHGLNDDDTCWEKQIGFFSKYYKCVVVNRTHSNKYMYEEELLDIIKKHRTGGKLYCVCASYGCEVSYNIQSQTNIFDKMVFMNYTWNPHYSYDLDMECGSLFKYVYNLWFVVGIIVHRLPFLNMLPLANITLVASFALITVATLLEYLISKRYIYADAYVGLLNCFKIINWCHYKLTLSNQILSLLQT